MSTSCRRPTAASPSPWWLHTPRPPPRPPPTPPPTGAAAAPRGLPIAGRLVQPGLNRIAGPGRRAPAQVEPKVMEVLVCLAETPGEVVSREALIDRVWKGGFVSDDVLTRSIGQ